MRFRLESIKLYSKVQAKNRLPDRRRIFIQAMYVCKLFVTLSLAAVCTLASASESESLDDITGAVDKFVRQQTAELRTEITVTRPDPRLRLSKCDTLETWLPSGNRLWGRASVGVRCRAPAIWSIYVPVLVKVSGNALVAARPIPTGQALSAEDVQVQTRDLTAFPGSQMANPDQVVGKTAAASIKAGDVIRPELLRSPLAIKQGQQVILIAQGAGFKVSSEGQAMGNASIGQVVAVKTRSGQTIKGIARNDGVVEVYF